LTPTTLKEFEMCSTPTCPVVTDDGGPCNDCVQFIYEDVMVDENGNINGFLMCPDFVSTVQECDNGREPTTTSIKQVIRFIKFTGD